MSEIPDAPNIREVERSPDGTVMLCNRSPTPSSPTGFQTQCLGTGFARMNNAPESPPLQNPLQWILTTNTSGKPLLFIIASALSGDLAHTKIELKSQTQTLSFTRFPCPSATKNAFLRHWTNPATALTSMTSPVHSRLQQSPFGKTKTNRRNTHSASTPTLFMISRAT